MFLRPADAEGDSSGDEEARARFDDVDPGRSRDREPSLMRDTGERKSKPQRDDRESSIWKWRRGVDDCEGHQLMRQGELVGEPGCGETESRGDGYQGETEFKSVTWRTSEEKNQRRTETWIKPQGRRD